ncbi:MAG: hypothetical protein NTX45_16615, partial [Proteobacteria bacterium]|nr:hypothetical protein [Pseudomonadota bacterium]
AVRRNRPAFLSKLRLRNALLPGDKPPTAPGNRFHISLRRRPKGQPEPCQCPVIGQPCPNAPQSTLN